MMAQQFGANEFRLPKGERTFAGGDTERRLIHGFAVVGVKDSRQERATRMGAAAHDTGAHCGEQMERLPAGRGA
jgi:hypothetical protein